MTNGLPASRVLVLDGIRGLAIALVLLHHFFEPTASEPPFVDRLAFGVAESGWIGVDLFFVLSGFLITTILCDTKGTPGYFVNFYARRTLRIFPLYYATLFLFFVVLPRVPHPLAAAYVGDASPDQAWFWTYLTNVRVAERGAWYDHLVPTVFWSLAIEEQFYVIWPILVLLFTRRTLIRLSVALIGVAAAVRVGLVLAEVNPIAVFVLTPARLDCLLTGALLALLVQDGHAFQQIVRAARWAAPALALLLLILALPRGTLDWQDALTCTLGFSAVALLCGAVLALGVSASPGAPMRRLFESTPLRVLGKYSYAMYIFHGPAGTLVKQAYDVEQAPRVLGSALPFTALYGVGATLLTLTMAYVSWYVFERHFLRLQTRFRRTPRHPDSHEATQLLPPVAVHASR